MFSGPPTERLAPDGTVTLPNVSPDKYRVMLRPVPDGYYIKAVRLGEQNGLENGIDLTAGAGGVIRVVLAARRRSRGRHGQQREAGAVAGNHRRAAPEKLALRENYMYTKTATTDQYGRHSFRGVDPGEYRVYAWDDVEMGAWMDADFSSPAAPRLLATKLFVTKL